MSSNTTDADYITRLNTISNQISFIYLVIIIPFGFVANCVSILIYLRPNLYKKTNTGFLYLCLSIMNIISLLNYAFIVRSNNLFGYTVTITCGVANYIRRNIFNATSWIQALISFDRFISIYFPIKSKVFKKKSSIILIMFAVMILILIANVSNLISFSVVIVTFNNRTNRTTITSSCDQTDQMSLLTDFLAILMRLYIPFTIMVVLNILVIKRLYKSKQKVKLNNQNSTNDLVRVYSNRNASSFTGITTFTAKEYKFTIATITMDLVFWIFYTPVSINLTLNIINTFTNMFASQVSMANYRFYSNISQLIAFTYHSIAIFFYIGFNQYFRTELVQILRINKIKPSFKSSTNANLRDGSNSVRFS